MGGALQGFGTPSVYPTPQLPWGFTQQGGQFGQFGQVGQQMPQLQQLQAAIHQLLQTGYTQQQLIQQLLQIVPQQLQHIQQLVQYIAQQHVYQQQQSYQSSPWQSQSPFSTMGLGGHPFSQSFGTTPSWLGSTQGAQPQMFGGQANFGQGYLM